MRTPSVLAALAVASLVPMTACPDGAGAGPGAGEGEGEGEGEEGTEDLVLQGEPVAIDIAPVLNVGIALAVRSDGRAAFAFVEPGAGTVECQLFGGETVTEETVDIKVADEQADGTFLIRTVASTAPIQDGSIEMAVDPGSDALVVAFQGGEPAAGVCQGSDLVVAVESGASFVTTTVARDGADGSGPCREGEDPLCAEGDYVGRFPALALRDGQLALAYTDNHFGFGETDIFESDLELVQGTSVSPVAVQGIRSINTETGSGYNTGIDILDDGTVVIGHQIIGNNIQDEGVYVELVAPDGTITEKLLAENPELTSRVSVAAREGQGIFVAFREDATDQLLLFRSVDDGATFTPEAVEQLSVTGLNPTVAFLSDGTLVVAYGHCRDVDNGNPLCDAGEDGVRVSWRSPGQTRFERKTFLGDDEDLEGVATDMAVTPDDEIVTVSFNASQSQALVHRIRKVTP